MSDRQMSLDEARRASANIIKTLPAEVYNAKAPNRFLKNVAKFNEAVKEEIEEDITFPLNEPVTITVWFKGATYEDVSAKAEEAVMYNCPEAVSIKTTLDWAADVSPFKNTDPDVVNDPDIMGWNIFIYMLF